MLRLDCENLRELPAVVDFSTGPAGTAAHAAHGCAALQMDLGGCPAACRQFRLRATH